MKSTYKISRQLELIKTNAFVTLLHRAPVVLLLVFIVLVGTKSQSANAGFEPAVPQGMNPQQVAAAIKANAQALKAFS